MIFAAGIYRGLCLESVKNKYECEIQAACQHWEVRGQRSLAEPGFRSQNSSLWGCLCDRHLSACQSEKLLLFDTVQSELEEKIRRLEEDRHSIDITSGSATLRIGSLPSIRPSILSQKGKASNLDRAKMGGLRRLVCVFPELWNDGLHSRKNKKKDPFCAVKKKKPVVVSDILSPELLACFPALGLSLLPPCCRVLYLDDAVTALYRLHAAGP